MYHVSQFSCEAPPSTAGVVIEDLIAERTVDRLTSCPAQFQQHNTKSLFHRNFALVHLVRQHADKTHPMLHWLLSSSAVLYHGLCCNWSQSVPISSCHCRPRRCRSPLQVLNPSTCYRVILESFAAIPQPVGLNSFEQRYLTNISGLSVFARKSSSLVALRLIGLKMMHRALDSLQYCSCLWVDLANLLALGRRRTGRSGQV